MSVTAYVARRRFKAGGRAYYTGEPYVPRNQRDADRKVRERLIRIGDHSVVDYVVTAPFTASGTDYVRGDVYVPKDAIDMRSKTRARLIRMVIASSGEEVPDGLVVQRRGKTPWYDVVGSDGQLVNTEALKKAQAEALAAGG